MANVFRRASPEYKISVHTPDFDVADWAINPDVSAVGGNPVKYWFLTGATNAEGDEIIDVVDAATQAIIDAALAAAQLTAFRDAAKTEFDAKRVLKAFAELLVDEFNVLRTIEGLPDRTFAQLRTAIRNKIDAMP
jgi:hypothetical protein